MAAHPELRARLSARTPKRVETPGLLQTAVSLIVVPGASGPEALFIRRAVRADDPWSGHAALPGGRREPGDADLFATAVRETAEEVGVELGRAALLGELDDLHPSTPRLPSLVIRPFVFGLESRPRATINEEVDAVIWIPLRDLEPCRAKAVVKVGATDREVDCFQAGGLTIWGLTYRILGGFLPLLE